MTKDQRLLQKREELAQRAIEDVRTSNELVKLLRAFGIEGSPNWRAADEIERLTRVSAESVEHWRKLYLKADRDFGLLRAEHERLRAILLTDDAAIEEVQAENARLRAALEISAETCETCYERAREALRPADETASVTPNRSVATISETLSNETGVPLTPWGKRK